MISFHDHPNRRDFLSVGSLLLGGLTLPQLLAGKAAGAPGATGAAGADILRDKSVIFLFMHGGPPQQETFDPKMTAPIGVRSTTGDIPTSVPGLRIGGTLHKLARLAHKYTIVRSFRTGDGNHDIKPIVGKDTLGANLGSLYARIAGANHPASGMPRNVALFPRAVDPNAGPEQAGFGKFTSTGQLGAAYAPFAPSTGGEAQSNFKLAIPRDRLDDRRSLLASLDTFRRKLDVTGELEGLDRFQSQALQTIVGGVADAFDLSKEDPRVVARYDTAPLISPNSISPAWNNQKHYRDNSQTLGKLLLMARRLCEAGAGFVTVTTNFVWDFHADQNNVPCTLGMNYVGIPFDHAVSAFIEDCEARGLGEKILLICCGEMGRTPKVNAKGGRDHWGGLAPLLIYGGGLKMGQVIGQSDKNASEPDTEPITPRNLIGTIMHTLFDVGQLRLQSSVPGDLARLIGGYEPIRELM
jgi:hypothetical protein